MLSTWYASRPVSGPEQWYLSAESRWAHLPSGDDRDRRVQQTFLDIRDEAEAVAVQLPELDDSERVALLEESVLDVLARIGLPMDDTAEEVFAHNVDLLFHRLCLMAREAKAPARQRSLLMERRLFRMAGIRRYLGLGPDA